MITDRQERVTDFEWFVSMSRQPYLHECTESETGPERTFTISSWVRTGNWLKKLHRLTANALPHVMYVFTPKSPWEDIYNNTYGAVLWTELSSVTYVTMFYKESNRISRLNMPVDTRRNGALIYEKHFWRTLGRCQTKFSVPCSLVESEVVYQR